MLGHVTQSLGKGTHATSLETCHREHAGGPGKRSLTEALAPVQHKMPEPALTATERPDMRDETAVHASAARGVATAASPLPFSDTLQRAFGRHDVSTIKAHVGGDAAASAAAMGATGYAAGNHVVFAGALDLHTAAHEAAHVMQQRGGYT